MPGKYSMIEEYVKPFRKGREKCFTRRDIIMATVMWESELEKALKRAQSEDKSVLIFFHNPH